MTATRRGHLAMLLFAALVSGSYSVSAIAAPHVHSAALTALRFGLAAAIMGAVVIVAARRDPAALGSALRAPWRYVALGGLLGFYFVLLFEALLLTDPTSASVVFALTPLMSAGFGRALLGQRVPPSVLVPLLIAGLGAAWVIFRADLSALLAFEIGEGEAIFFIGCAAHALYTPLVRRWHRGEPVPVYVFGMMLGGLLVVGAYGLGPLLRTDWAALPTEVWLALAYLSLAASSVSFYLLQYAALRLPPAKSMAYIYLLPALVILWEGALGHGWPPAAILPGVAATALALLLLLRE